MSCVAAKLDVPKNSIDVVGAKAIVEAVKVNAELTTKVAFDFNSIGLDGAEAINREVLVKVDSVVTTLDLNANSIGDDDAKAITPSWSILD